MGKVEVTAPTSELVRSPHISSHCAVATQESAAADTCCLSTAVLGRVLEVTDLPEGITRTEADKLFTQLAMAGAKIQWLKETQGRRGDGGGGDNNGTPENGRHSDLAALYTIVAVFPSPLAAQNASLRLNNSLSRFKLRVAKKNYDLRVLERASSQ